ncbi:COP9 signalosome-like protein complex subunit 4 [Aureobasidium pullulans]|uniref:COP9 signalosome complex subunit 4 n=1 Tax=Aureobasidium pullulans TaxID=5580 RepID=A0A4S8S376_AURPU|nr:COP9 signalosome-like protein complex subunit 4 [Aureobasidium pullulans]
MASEQVTDALLALEDAQASKKAQGYNELLDKILASSSASDDLPANLIAYVQSILGDSVGIVTSRPLLALFVGKLASLPDADIKIQVGTNAIDALAPKVVSYEDQDSQIKLMLADSYEQNEDFTSSAKVLQQITLDSSQRHVSDDDKAKIWIRITRCYLEEDDPINALSYLNRVKNVIYNVQDQTTKLQFQLSQARISDSQRNFLDASNSYLNLSLEPVIDEEERLQALSAAIICVVLAPAGPKRARQLARLYKDDRTPQVNEFAILEKIFLDRVLSPEEVKAFAEKLQPHQMAKTADGSTVLDKAVLEHNLLGVSRLYSNILIDNLGPMLGVDSDRAEAYAAQMIEQGRLSGYIDQIDGLIHFSNDSGADGSKGGAANLGTRELRMWDASVQALCEEVERVATMIQTAHPEFYALHMGA